MEGIHAVGMLKGFKLKCNQYAVMHWLQFSVNNNVVLNTFLYAAVQVCMFFKFVSYSFLAICCIKERDEKRSVAAVKQDTDEPRHPCVLAAFVLVQVKKPIKICT